MDTFDDWIKKFIIAKLSYLEDEEFYLSDVGCMLTRDENMNEMVFDYNEDHRMFLARYLTEFFKACHEYDFEFGEPLVDVKIDDEEQAINISCVRFIIFEASKKIDTILYSDENYCDLEKIVLTQDVINDIISKL